MLKRLFKNRRLEDEGFIRYAEVEHRKDYMYLMENLGRRPTAAEVKAMLF